MKEAVNDRLVVPDTEFDPLSKDLSRNTTNPLRREKEAGEQRWVPFEGVILLPRFVAMFCVDCEDVRNSVLDDSFQDLAWHAGELWLGLVLVRYFQPLNHVSTSQ